MRRALHDLIALWLPGWDVLDAADGATALRLAAEGRPRLVLIDICLPDANGIALTQCLMTRAPDTLVVVISIQSSNYIVERALTAGAAAFIEKDRLSTELSPLIARLHEGVDMATQKLST